MTNLEKLKPCPFCGGDAFVQPQQGDNPKPFAWDIIHHCGNVGFIRMAPRDLRHLSTKEQAIAAWNTRASDAALLVAEKALRKIAAFDDVGASEVADLTGSYGCFDEPASVQVSRAALSEIEKLTGGGE